MKRHEVYWAVAPLLLAVFLTWGVAGLLAAAPGGAREQSNGSTAAGHEKLRQQRLRQLLAEAMAAYRQDDIETAAARWREVLLIDPKNERAANYLKETSAQLDRHEAAGRQREQALRAQAEARRQMAEKITIETKEGGTRLSDLLRTLSFVTRTDFNLVGSADPIVVARFEDKTLREVLDAVLAPHGLSWKRDGDIVTVAPSVRTRVLHLDSDTLLAVQKIYESRELQRLLWGADAPPADNVALTLDERNSVLMLVDSPANVAKLEGFLRELRRQPPLRLITRTYTVRADIVHEAKALAEALLRTETAPAYEQERKILLAEVKGGYELVIKDTEENLRRVEELFNDRQFMRRLEEQQLEVYTANLTPRDILKTNTEQVEAFGRDVKEVVETILYHKGGVAAARREGRRLWFDPSTLQLTITDYPSNIRKVAEFVQALPQLEPRLRSKILYLDYAGAGDMAAQLEQVLGVRAAGAAAGAAAGTQASFSLRVEDERTFRDLSIRLVRVDENNFADDNDDSCELVVRTSTAQSSDLNMPEYRSEVFEAYEILVEEVNPSPTPGEGRIRLRVTYRPDLGGGY